MVNTKELMYGDYVHCITDNTNYKFGRLSRNPECHYDIDEHLNFNYDIEPVPLTKKMLRLNGFRFCNGGKIFTEKYYYIHDGDFRFCIFIADDTLRVRIADEDFFILDYVHELQHALRLCGLNEVADNFRLQ